MTLDYNPNLICNVEDCAEFVARRQWCRRHYRLNRLYGTPTYDSQIRFKTKIDNRTHKVCTKCQEDLSMERFARNSKNLNGRGRYSRCDDCRRFYSLLNVYNVTRERYYSILEQQKGLCAICLKVPSKFFIDHDHKCCLRGSCGKCIRGLLCPGCNSAIGNLSEDPEVFARALSYLKLNNHGEA